MGRQHFRIGKHAGAAGLHVGNHQPGIGLTQYVDPADQRRQIGNGSLSGSTYVIAELDGAYTRYHEVTLESEWRTSKSFVRGSYTWSRYYGNFDQDNSTTGNDANIFIGSSNIADGAGRQLWDFKDGTLRGDRPHSLKLYGYYLLGWNASIGTYILAQSGQPWELWSYEPYRALTTSTSSTTTPAPSTTSTTIIGGTCVPANCDDGDACTEDSCQNGVCMHSNQGFDATVCELGKLLEPGLCGADPIDAKLQRAIRVKTTKARNLIGKAENNTRFGAKLLGRAAKNLTSLFNRIGKSATRGKITPACRATLFDNGTDVAEHGQARPELLDQRLSGSARSGFELGTSRADARLRCLAVIVLEQPAEMFFADDLAVARRGGIRSDRRLVAKRPVWPTAGRANPPPPPRSRRPRPAGDAP